jgi:Na+/melibiose symporter-like transporter
MSSLTRSQLINYGAFGLPLAMVALPIYMFVPQFYAARFGLSLSLIGSALLLAHLLDAFVDPLIGLWIDRQGGAYVRALHYGLPLLVCGFITLFHPPQSIGGGAFVWFMCTLMVVYLGFSLASISYQSWGAALTQALSQRSQVTGIREASGLVGVIIAATLMTVSNPSWLSLAFVTALTSTALLLLRYAPRPSSQLHFNKSNISARQVLLSNLRFRWLFGVFLLNGIAAAIPATLFLFFVNDRLLLAQYAGVFLIVYFLSAAVSMPLWVALAKIRGERVAWLWAMLLAIFTFIWAYFIGAGEVTGFALICLLSGAALGADLALPPALLAAVIGAAGHSGKHEGVYFGVWNWATKLNLALAAGIALPALQFMGYGIGTTDESGLHALAIGYAVLPCVLKISAALLLSRSPLSEV